MTTSNQLAQLGSPGVSTGFKNRIINGAMVIDQRNAGASVTPTADGTYTLDRWKVGITQASKFSVQQNAGSVTPPVGFNYYLGCTSLSPYSVPSSDVLAINQCIEGYNFADLAWGTSNAKTVTLSAWVYSSLTGTFGGAIQNSAQNRSYPFSYSIPTANTWTQISITIAGDTSGTWVGATNGVGSRIWFSLGAGSTVSGTANAWAGANYYSATGATSVVGTSGATFYITGVQLEVGTNATSFDYRPYGTELNLCQRYYERRTVGNTAANERIFTTGMINAVTGVQVAVQYFVQKRSSSVSASFTNFAQINFYNGNSYGSPTAYSVDNAGQYVTNFSFTGISTASIGLAVQAAWSNSAPYPYAEFSSEL